MSNAVNRTLMMNKKILTCIIATLLGGTICAGNRYVSHLTGNDGDGKSWANAKTSISAAIFDVGVGDTMFIAEGPYYESISVQDGATYLGGYNAETGERDVNLYETTIIGSGDDSYLIVKYDAAPENHILIDGITIPYGSMSSFGAPVYLRGNMTLNNCLIRHCSGAQAGAIYLEQGEATVQGVVSNCIIEFCTSTDYAGAIYNDGGIVENCIIRGCQGKYSGIYNRTNGIIQNCVLYNNSGNVASSRGCIYCLGGQVINCTVCNNYGTQYSGIYLSQGQVVNCVFWGNQSEEGFTNPPNYISSSSDSHHNITDNGTSADAFLSITLNIENNAADGPNFVNPTTFVGVHTNVEDSIAMISADFSLTAASTALLSQAASIAPSTDIIGIQRPQGAGVDIGAYEYTIASGKCGADADSANVTWVLGCDSVLIISGTGAMMDNNNNSMFNPGGETNPQWAPARTSRNAKMMGVETPWTNYRYAVKIVRIEEGVTHVGDDAFSDCPNITQVSMPESLTSIGSYAFAYASRMHSVTIPTNVTEIEDKAFYNCTNLDTIYCNNPVPATISSTTFTTQSTSVLIVPAGSIEQYKAAAYWSTFANIQSNENIPSTDFSVPYIFVGETATLSGNIQLNELGHIAYNDKADNGVASWMINVTRECNVKVTITMEAGSSSGHQFVVDVLDENQEVIAELTQPSRGYSDSSIELPDSIAFITPGVYTIRLSNLTEWSAAIVEGVIFTAITPSSNPCIIASGSCGADGDNLTWVLGCDSVLTISGEGEMPTSYSGTSAPWYEYGAAIKHINIEEGVTKLALYAFYNSGGNYPNVQTLSIPSTLGAPIENNFFYQCPLKTVTINSDTIVGRASYSSGSSLQTKFGAQVEEYIIGGSVRSIADFAFRNQSPDSLRSIILPEGLEAIGNWAFGYIEHMTSISIPSTVQTIGTDAFAYCTNLRSVELGEGLMTVNGQAFWMCDSLTRVTCNALTPPTLNQTAFDHNQNDTLFIPCEAKESYKQADYWKNFSKIICADDTLQIIASGTCGAQGDNLMWVFDRDSVLTISGSSAMADWVDGSLVPWYDVREDIRTVIIEEGVTTIGDRAFYYFTRLIDVSYPTTLTSIGIGVFDFCSALPEIDGLRYAGAYLAGVPVMAQDTITTYTIRQGTRFIGHSAFHGCSQLKRITLPEGVTHILSSAFTGCNRLTKIDLPATVTDIQRYAFESDTLLTTFINRAVTPQTLPSSSTESAFYNCKLSKCTLYVPEESISLYQAATYWQDFGAIRSLEDVPCILAEGTFGAQGDNLAWTVDCDDMLTISGSGEMEFFHASEPWANFRYQLRKIVVEEGVTNLSNVFRLHNQVTEVSLPNTLRVIEAQAFDQCSSLRSLDLPESVDSIGEGVFYLCESLQEIRIPSRVTMINSSLFRGCRGLRSVEFPEGLKRILTEAFQYCNELNTLRLPASLTFIGQEAFADCTGLDTIIVLATTPPEVTQSAFDNVPDTIPVFVPTASLRAYRNHEEWSYFKNIHGIDGDGPETHTFTLTSSWQFIMLPTMFGLTQDDIVVDGEIEWGIYNSEQRASGRSGWQGFVPTSGFEGSQAYIVRARNGSATLTIHIPDLARDQAAATMPISYHPATREQNANWNFLGNPYPYSYDILSALEEAEIESPVTVWNGTGYDVFTPGIDLKTLDPFEAFFIQLPDGGSEVLPLSPEHIKDSSSSNGVADENGALPGYFTINTSKEKVQFSRGNLQYQASTATWQFAENQYEVIGDGNANISATYDGWIDLFGWGTGNEPTKTNTDKCTYSTFVDWGTNAISNGGNTADMWRTLSGNEWTYITGQRTNHDSLCGRATVNGIQGFILLPDDWVSPGVPFQGSKDNGYELNQYSLKDWQKMETAGAVFLPACGSRTGTEFSNGAVQYWSTNAGSSCYAYDIITGGDTAFRLKTNQVERSSAFGVRLVK